MTEADATPLQAIIEEFRNISPEITDAFMFNTNGEIIARSEPKTTDRAKKSIFSFNDVNEKAEVIGGIETLSIQAADSQLNVVTISNRYLATVYSRAANPKVVKALTTVIVPTVVKLIDELASEVSEPELNLKKSEEENAGQTTCPKVAPDQNKSLRLNSELTFPDPPLNQFMVEEIQGSFLPSGVVRIDAELVEKWVSLYGEKLITHVQIETLEGKAVICKYKPMKESNPNVKGIVQIPEKVLQALQTSKGKLVIIKPVVK